MKGHSLGNLLGVIVMNPCFTEKRRRWGWPCCQEVFPKIKEPDRRAVTFLESAMKGDAKAPETDLRPGFCSSWENGKRMQSEEQTLDRSFQDLQRRHVSQPRSPASSN